MTEAEGLERIVKPETVCMEMVKKLRGLGVSKSMLRCQLMLHADQLLLDFQSQLPAAAKTPVGERLLIAGLASCNERVE